MFTGTLTGAVIVLPEPAETLWLPVTLPLPAPSPSPEGGMPIVDLAPASQPEFAKPSTASEMPHKLTGALIGAVTVFPDSSETLPLPVTLPLPEAWATLAPGSANMAATSAVPAVADTHLTFFISLLQSPPCGRVRDGRRFSARTHQPAKRRRRGPRRNHCSYLGRTPRSARSPAWECRPPLRRSGQACWLDRPATAGPRGPEAPRGRPAGTRAERSGRPRLHRRQACYQRCAPIPVPARAGRWSWRWPGGCSPSQRKEAPGWTAG